MSPNHKKQKRRIGAQLSSGQARQMEDAIALAEAYYSDISDAWVHMSRAQRSDYLVHSPVLSRLLTFSKRFLEV